MRFRGFLVAAMVGTLALVAGCSAVRGGSAGPSGSAGSATQTITVGGQQRTFRLYRPATLPGSTPVPLVVMLHGGFGSGTQAESTYGWDAEADAGHFVVAYPDGLDRAWAVGGGCCGASGRTGVDDVGFIVQLVGTVSHELTIDPARVYATGISNGGLLAYRLACDTDLFAAIGPDSATLLGTCPSPKPVSVIHIHGTADPNIPYNGGEGDGIAHINGPAVPALNQMWRDIDRCAAPSASTRGPVTTSVATCDGGRVVELVTIAGGGHTWPGAGRAGKTDPPGTDLSATDTIWRFFAAHPRG
ncbi:MAG: polyhydroxybutyrate depolymerase [Actinobacteria bacterium 13_2_20CM_2_71_6]|nr:MAG: polyhydroxybutyrate depolymerase [Actinobacteria bacterium 13_2_20CM_2_71_6]